MIILHYLRQNVDYTHEIIDMLLFKGIENKLLKIFNLDGTRKHLLSPCSLKLNHIYI